MKPQSELFRNRKATIGYCMALGVAIGAGGGALIGNLAVGIALGIAAGAMVAVTVSEVRSTGWLGFPKHDPATVAAP
jgi:zinc transporter ZupT